MKSFHKNFVAVKKRNLKVCKNYIYISFPLIIIYDLIIYTYIYIKSKCDLKKQYLTLISETIHLEEGESTRAWNIQKKTSRRKDVK